jgi:hypothetical protein
VWGRHMAMKALKRWSTEELQSAVHSDTLNKVEKYEAERILKERERAPERRLARMSYNSAAWAEAYSMGTIIVALIILWLLATGKSLP